jgi:hypothetical protein
VGSEGKAGGFTTLLTITPSPLSQVLSSPPVFSSLQGSPPSKRLDRRESTGQGRAEELGLASPLFPKHKTSLCFTGKEEGALNLACNVLLHRAVTSSEELTTVTHSREDSAKDVTRAPMDLSSTGCKEVPGKEE